MKLYKVELRTVPMIEHKWDSLHSRYVERHLGFFSYEDVLRQVVSTAGEGGSLTMGEIILALSLSNKIKDAMESSVSNPASPCPAALLTKEDYDYLRVRLKRFGWAFAHSVIVDMISYIDKLTPTDFKVTEAPRPQEDTPAPSAS